MQTIPGKGFALALMAGAALSLSLPAFAADRHHHRHKPRVGVVVKAGPHRGVVRFKRFHHGPVVRLSIGERERWRHGRWWHGKRHGRVGWWWFTGGIWYWYPTAVYPYPTEISAEAVYDYAPEGRPDDSWYYCDDPEGYYPYVQTCSVDWKPVPIQPQASADGAYGEPPYVGGDDEVSGDGGYDDENMDNEEEEEEEEPVE
jgi:hypothetical protein